MIVTRMRLTGATIARMLPREATEAAVARVVDVQQHKARALERSKREPRVLRAEDGACIDSADSHVDGLRERVEPHDHQLHHMLTFSHVNLRLTEGDLCHSLVGDTQEIVGYRNLGGRYVGDHVCIAFKLPRTPLAAGAIQQAEVGLNPEDPKEAQAANYEPLFPLSEKCAVDLIIGQPVFPYFCVLIQPDTSDLVELCR
eukprot:scaffold117936_cov63-Phaeocystis_antarctica.AAC.2